MHFLGEGNSRRYALELMEQLEKFKRIDFPSVGTAVPAVHGRLGEASLPKEPDPAFSTDYLFGEARGQMFGVLECEDAEGNTVVLKAFSCQYDGKWLIDGWVPPIIDPQQFDQLIEEPDREINIRTQALLGMEPGHPERERLNEERRVLSQELMRNIHELYTLANFCGETRKLTEMISGNIPTGTGECCAPKLLNYAALNGLKPVGISEFYFGKESKSGKRQHKQFYPACVEKCFPILGFMLCGAVPPCNLKILYADEDIVVVVKPSGLLSVPGKGPKNQDCITARIKKIFPDCPDHPEVHRLDMDTSGLMVLALNADAHRELSRQFHDRETKKRYIALLDGELKEESGIIKLPFRLDVENRPRQIYDPVHGKTGITRWKKLGIENGKTRVEFFPITGRTHQLRVHSASEHGLGLPILGDRLYGSGTVPGQLKLHAQMLSFRHPRTGRKMEFTSEPEF